MVRVITAVHPPIEITASRRRPLCYVECEIACAEALDEPMMNIAHRGAGVRISVIMSSRVIWRCGPRGVFVGGWDCRSLVTSSHLSVFTCWRIIVSYHHHHQHPHG